MHLWAFLLDQVIKSRDQCFCRYERINLSLYGIRGGGFECLSTPIQSRQRTGLNGDLAGWLVLAPPFAQI